MFERLAEITVGGVHLRGYSLAGEESVIAAPELNVCFDIGKCPKEALPIDHVLLSHGHMDHAAGLGYYFSQRSFVGNSPGTVLLPETLVAPVRHLLRSWDMIEGHESPANVIGMKPGDEYEIRRDLVAVAFAVRHGCPSLGFTVVEKRHKLKQEYAECTPNQLVELKRQGTRIDVDVRIPLVTYLGDTAPFDYHKLDLVNRSKVLLIECTFFEPDHVRRARAGNHLHVNDLRGVLEPLECEHFVIIHISRRTSLPSAKKMIERALPPEILDRVHFLMERRPSRRQAPSAEKK